MPTNAQEPLKEERLYFVAQNATTSSGQQQVTLNQVFLSSYKTLEGGELPRVEELVALARNRLENPKDFKNRKIRSRTILQYRFPTFTGRSRGEVLAWNGLCLIDLDANPVLKQSVRREDQDRIRQGLDKLLNFMRAEQWTHKLSLSGTGMHALIEVKHNFGWDDLEGSIEARDMAYSYFFSRVEDFLDREGLCDDFMIDEKFIVNSWMGIALSDSALWKYYDRPYSLEEIKREMFALNMEPKKFPNEFINVSPKDRQTMIDSTGEVEFVVKNICKTEDFLVSEKVEELKTVFRRHAAHIRDKGLKVVTNEARFIVAALAQAIGISKDEWLALYDPKVYGESCSEADWELKYADAGNYPVTNFLSTSFVLAVFRALNNTTKLNQFVAVEASDVLPCIERYADFVDTINVKRYAGEAADKLYTLFKTQKRLLLSGKTNIGKSYLIADLVRRLFREETDSVIVIAGDTVIQSEQFARQYRFSWVAGKGSPEFKEAAAAGEPGIYVATYDSMKYFNSIDYLFVDEVHQLVDAVDYRRAAIRCLSEKMNATQFVFAVTATPDYLYPLISNYQFVKVVSNHFQQRDVYHLSCKKSEIVPEVVAEHLTAFPHDGQTVIFINSKYSLERLRTLLWDHGYGKNMAIVHSNMPESNLAGRRVLQHVRDEERLPEDLAVLGTTNMLQNGINIKNSGKIRVYSANLEKTAVEQFVSRFREAEIELFLISNIPERTKLKKLQGNGLYSYFSRVIPREVDRLNGMLPDGQFWDNFSDFQSKEGGLIDLDKVSGRFYFNPFQAALKIKEMNARVYQACPEKLGMEISFLAPVNPVVNQQGLDDEKAERKRLWEDHMEDIVMGDFDHGLLRHYTIRKKVEAINYILAEFPARINIREAASLITTFGSCTFAITAFYFQAQLGDVLIREFLERKIDPRLIVEVEQMRHLYDNLLAWGGWEEGVLELTSEEIDMCLREQGRQFDYSNPGKKRILSAMFEYENIRVQRDGVRKRGIRLSPFVVPPVFKAGINSLRSRALCDPGRLRARHLFPWRVHPRR